MEYVLFFIQPLGKKNKKNNRKQNKYKLKKIRERERERERVYRSPVPLMDETQLKNSAYAKTTGHFKATLIVELVGT